MDKRPDAARERRNDEHVAELIDVAVEMQRADSARLASSFLNWLGVKEHIILRVLACAAFRGKRKR
jgi:hypothetical protein